jgi:hypothetical protein
VGLIEDLTGCLTKLRDLGFESEALDGITQDFQVNTALIRNRVKHIVVID